MVVAICYNNYTRNVRTPPDKQISSVAFFTVTPEQPFLSVANSLARLTWHPGDGLTVAYDVPPSGFVQASYKPPSVVWRSIRRSSYPSAVDFSRRHRLWTLPTLADAAGINHSLCRCQRDPSPSEMRLEARRLGSPRGGCTPPAAVAPKKG